jgi:hypothetical protein
MFSKEEIQILFKILEAFWTSIDYHHLPSLGCPFFGDRLFVFLVLVVLCNYLLELLPFS